MEIAESESKNSSAVNEEYDILPNAADIPDDAAAASVAEEVAARPVGDDVASAWDSCHVDKESSPPEAEVTNGESDIVENGNVTKPGSSPNKQSLDHKKKKPLLRKFGSLLKKKGNPK